MAKCTGYTIIHYKVVGVFSGQTPVLVAKPLESQALVTDRVEFEVDWNQQEFKLVGTPLRIEVKSSRNPFDDKDS